MDCTMFTSSRQSDERPDKAKSGRERSVHCLGNTGARRYLVVEFDGGTLDEQAALIVYLGTLASLVLVVFSGAKSLHAWFSVKGIADVEEFFVIACRLGADPATWTPCQFVRMPGGTRSGGARQRVYWFNPKEVHHG
jgi:hypothetical protein